MPLPGETLTFLFTDIEGSTKLWEQYPEQMRQALARHDLLLRQAIERNHGLVFKTMGDAFCAVFTSASDALNAALAAQLALQELNQERQKGRRGEGEKGSHRETFPFSLNVRMALHTGTVEYRDNDYFGPPLNRTTRLLAAGHGAQVLLSDSVRQLVCSALPPNVTLQDRGEHRLKDLQRPEHIWQLNHPDLPSEFPPLKSLNVSLHNLPQQMTSFIGREKEIAAIKTLFAGTRLLTLTGSGGTGKSRLCLQVAAEMLEDFADGVWLVELASLTDPALVTQTVASVLGIKEAAGKPLMQTLIEALRLRKLLLLLDNCEHVLEPAASLVHTLLQQCAGVQILTSSREALSIAGESTYRVPSLALPPLPDREAKQAMVDLLEYESARLFVDRARQVKADFTLTAANAPALARMCHRLDGIPLALELAAARVRVLSVEQIEARLHDRFRLLTGGSRTALPRQQTLQATLDWSYDLLSDLEKLLLARLSVFSGGWTLDAAEQVCSAAGVQVFRSSGVQEKTKPTLSNEVQLKIERGISEPEYLNTRTPEHLSSPEYLNTRIPEYLNTSDILDLLTSLVDKSLVVYEPQQRTDRYRLLETIGQYAGDRLMEASQVELLRRKHRDYFLQLAEEANKQLSGANQVQALEQLETEHDNLRAALDWCLSEGKREEGRGKREEGIDLSSLKSQISSLSFVGALSRFWRIRGYFSEGRERAAAVLALPQAQAPTRERANALNGAMGLAWFQGDYNVAQSLQEENLAIRRALGDKQGVADALGNLSILAQEQGDYAAARSLMEESLTLNRELSNKAGITDCLIGLGIYAAQQGDYVTARSLMEESLALYREMGDKLHIANSLNNLSLVLKRQGDYAAARSLMEESLVLLREVGDKRGIVGALCNLAELLTEQGDYPAARSYLLECLSRCPSLGSNFNAGYALEAAAELAHKLQRSEQAVRLYGAAQALRERIGVPLPPNEQQDHARNIAELETLLGQEIYEAAYATGQSLSTEQAIEYALQNSEE